MGINTKRTYNIAFGLSLALVGVAAALLVPNFAVYPKVGGYFGLKSFIIVILGGKGNVKGALFAGILVCVIERIGAIVSTESYALLLVFAVFLLLLLFKPEGIFSKRPCLGGLNYDETKHSWKDYKAKNLHSAGCCSCDVYYPFLSATRI